MINKLCFGSTSGRSDQKTALDFAVVSLIQRQGRKEKPERLVRNGIAMKEIIK